MAADLTYERWLQIGQPDMILPAVRADHDMIGALVVTAVDQEATNAH